MWPFRKRPGRRLEAVRSRIEGEGARWGRLRESGLGWALAIAALFAAAATGTMLVGGRAAVHHAGQYLGQDYIARVPFVGPDLADPGQTRTYQRGHRVVEAGTIQEGELELIRLEQQAYLSSPRATPVVLYESGLACVVLLVTVGLGAYALRHEPRLVREPRRTMALAAVMLLVILGGRLAMLATWRLPLIYFSAVLLALLAVMVLGIAYNQRLAISLCWMLSVLVAVAARQDFQFLVVLLATVTVGGMSLGSIRSRTKLLVLGGATAAAGLVATLAIGLVVGEPEADLLVRGGMVAVACIAAALVVQGVLPLIERLFNVATAMTLLEFSDVSKPLLRRLAADCPGTFNHSLLLGTMVEAAADAIGADGLLARVGAYYHDIGKINKPDYFVENQAGSYSRHAKLSPAMSLLIILSHVKDGLEMARQYNVPAVMHPFITEHHGTTLVEYFYHAATRLSPDQAPPAEIQFRYPGPKPQSKETAILMLADAVEGATRALAEPTPGRIEDLVHQIARRRLDDGQLDECNLTLRELHTVEQSLVKSLCSFYHGRISYPADGAKPEAASRSA